MSSGSSSTKSNPTLTLISILPSSILIVVVESLIFFNFISLSCLASYSSQTNGERSQLCVLEALRFSLVPSSIPSSSPLFFNRIQNLPQKLRRFVFIFLQWEPGVSHSKIQSFQLEISHRFLNFLWNSLSLQVCDCWWWQCGWLCGKDFRRTRNGRWTPCDRIQRGSEIKFPILFEIFYLVIVIEVLVGFVNRPMLLMSVQPWRKDICSL